MSSVCAKFHYLNLNLETFRFQQVLIEFLFLSMHFSKKILFSKQSLTCEKKAT